MLFVGQLPNNASKYKDELRDLFTPFGPLKRFDLKNCFAFVTYESKDNASKALESLNGTNFYGRELNVEFTREKKRARSPSRSRSPDAKRRRVYRKSRYSSSRSSSRSYSSQSRSASPSRNIAQRVAYRNYNTVPARRTSRSPVRRAGRSPIRRVSRSPIRRVSRSPIRRVSRSPVRYQRWRSRSRSISRRRSRSRSISISRSRSPARFSNSGSLPPTPMPQYLVKVSKLMSGVDSDQLQQLVEEALPNEENPVTAVDIHENYGIVSLRTDELQDRLLAVEELMFFGQMLKLERCTSDHTMPSIHNTEMSSTILTIYGNNGSELDQALQRVVDVVQQEGASFEAEIKISIKSESLKELNKQLSCQLSPLTSLECSMY